MESSPLWAVALLAILFGPIVAALVYGLRHRDSGAPEHDDATEAHAYMTIAKELKDVQDAGRRP